MQFHLKLVCLFALAPTITCAMMSSTLEQYCEAVLHSPLVVRELSAVEEVPWSHFARFGGVGHVPAAAAFSAAGRLS